MIPIPMLINMLRGFVCAIPHIGSHVFLKHNTPAFTPIPNLYRDAKAVLAFSYAQFESTRHQALKHLSGIILLTNLPQS